MSAKSYSCSSCSKQFSHRQSFNRHKKFSQCNESLQLLKCSNCEKEFKLNYNLDRHKISCKRRLHQFCCNVCDMKFHNNCFLKRHLQSHAKKTYSKKSKKITRKDRIDYLLLLFPVISDVCLAFWNIIEH